MRGGEIGERAGRFWVSRCDAENEQMLDRRQIRMRGGGLGWGEEWKTKGGAKGRVSADTLEIKERYFILISCIDYSVRVGSGSGLRVCLVILENRLKRIRATEGEWSTVIEWRHFFSKYYLHKNNF